LVSSFEHIIDTSFFGLLLLEDFLEIDLKHLFIFDRFFTVLDHIEELLFSILFTPDPSCSLIGVLDGLEAHVDLQSDVDGLESIVDDSHGFVSFVHVSLITLIDKIEHINTLAIEVTDLLEDLEVLSECDCFILDVVFNLKDITNGFHTN